MKSKQFHFIGILEEERKEKKQQADEAAKQIKNLQGRVVTMSVSFMSVIKSCD